MESVSLSHPIIHRTKIHNTFPGLNFSSAKSPCTGGRAVWVRLYLGSSWVDAVSIPRCPRSTQHSLFQLRRLLTARGRLALLGRPWPAKGATSPEATPVPWEQPMTSTKLWGYSCSPPSTESNSAGLPSSPQGSAETSVIPAALFCFSYPTLPPCPLQALYLPCSSW